MVLWKSVGNDGDRWCNFFLRQSSRAAHFFPAAMAAERNCKISKTGFSALNFGLYRIRAASELQDAGSETTKLSLE